MCIASLPCAGWEEAPPSRAACGAAWGIGNILLGRWGPLAPVQCYFSTDSKNTSHRPVMPACSRVTWAKGLQPRSRALGLSVMVWPRNWSTQGRGNTLLSRRTGLSLIWVCLEAALRMSPSDVFPSNPLACFPLCKAWQTRASHETPLIFWSSANASLWIFSYFVSLFIRSLLGLSAGWWDTHSSHIGNTVVWMCQVLISKRRVP